MVLVTMLGVMIETLVVARTKRVLPAEPPVDPNPVTTQTLIVDLSRRP